MNLQNMIVSGRLDPDFPLDPDLPFTGSMAAAAGVSSHTLKRLVATGVLRHPIRGVYLATLAGDSLELRLATLRLVVPPGSVLVDRHAGWLWGADMVLAPGEHLSLRPITIFRLAGRGRLRNALSDSGERWLPPRHLTELGGLTVTTPIRTAWDLGRVRSPYVALSGIDAMLRIGDFTVPQLVAGVEQFRGHRHVCTLRAVAPLGSPLAESPPESVLRLKAKENHLEVTPQVVVRDEAGIPVARLDLGDEDSKTGLEYDGAEWHSTPDQQSADGLKREIIAALGWHVEVFVRADVFGPHQNVDDRLIKLRQVVRQRLGTRVVNPSRDRWRRLDPDT